MKIVYCPEKKEVITIDESKEPNRKKKYWHRSGKPFEWQETKLEISFEDLSNEKLCDLVEEKRGKPVAQAWRNRREWLLEQLS